MNGSRFNPVLRVLYRRLLAAGKPPKLAVIALARKLLTILNAMVRDGTDWKHTSAQAHSATVACWETAYTAGPEPRLLCQKARTWTEDLWGR